MGVLLLAIPAAVVALVALLVLVLGRRPGGGLVQQPPDHLARIARHTTRWQLAGLLAGLLGAVVVATNDRFGGGLLLAAPTFGLAVLSGALVGEVTVIHPPSGPARAATLETRRVRDYLPARLATTVMVSAAALALLLVVTSVTATSDDLGRAGRGLRQLCPNGTIASGGPWPGSFYAIPVAVVVAAGLVAAGIVLRRVVRRPRAAADAELRAVDDRIRRRAAQVITAASGILVAAPLAGTATIAGGRLLELPCTPPWATAAGWGLLAVAIAALGVLSWLVAALLAPLLPASPAPSRAGPG